MRRTLAQFTTEISRALISASTKTHHPLKWTPPLEQTLHQLGCRNSLSAAVVAGVIDPFLLRHHSLALGFFNWASQQPNFSHSSLSYQSLLKSLSLSSQFHLLQKLLSQITAQKLVLDPSIYRDIFKSLLLGKKTHLAYSIIKSHNLIHIESIGAETCNSLLAALSAEENLKCAREVFDKMIERKVCLNTVGFGVFLWRCCSGMELGEVLGLIDVVRGEGGFVGVDGSIIAVLVVCGLCSRMRVSEAVLGLGELRDRGCKPDFMAYRVVVEALRGRGELDKVDDVLRRKRKFGVAPRAMEYGRFILLLISEKLICEAKEMGEVIVDGNFPIEDEVLDALIRSVSSVDPSSAVSFLNFMLRKQRFPTLHCLIGLSKNLVKHGKVNDLMEVINRLSEKGFFKDAESYKEMIKLMCKIGHVQEAYQFLREMKKKGISPDVEAYNTILEGCCREDKLRPARRLWDEMFTNGYVVDRTSYRILILKFSEEGEEGDVDAAYNLFCQMLGKGIVPDRSIYISLLEGFCKAKNLEKALLVFGKCVEQDLTLAQHLLGSFILSLCKEGFFADASKLLLDFNGKPGQVDSHVKLLKLLGNAGEVALAMEHLRCIRKRSPQDMHALHAALSTSLHPTLELDQIIRFCESQKVNSFGQVHA